MALCLSCSKETTNPKFCSRSCSAKYTGKHNPKRKTNKKCVKCEKNVKSYRHSHCEEHHIEYLQSLYSYTKELTLEDYWSRKSLQNLHSSSKNVHIRSLARSWFKHLLILPCKRCGYSKHVELCHIKPIKDFNSTSKIKDINSEENLIQLCPNCHWEFDRGLFSLDELGIA